MSEPGTNRIVTDISAMPNVSVKWREGSEPYTVHITDLSKMELCKACKLAFPSDKYPGRTWPWFTVDEMRNALLTNTCPPPKGRSEEIQLKDPNRPATDKQINYIRSLMRKANTNTLQVSKGSSNQVQYLTMGEAKAEIEALQELIKNGPKPEAPKSTYKPTPTEYPAPVAPTVDLTEINERLDKMDGKIHAVTTLINDMRPQVTEIHVPQRETVVIEGRQHKEFPRLLEMIGMGWNIYLVGPPGTGKSYMAEQAAYALGLEFGSASLDPTMDATELFGYRNADGIYQSTPYFDRFTKGGVFLFDEFDHGHGGILSKINGGVANGICDFGGSMHRRHEDSVILAAANTLGRGRTRSITTANELNPATRNRFRYLHIDYDDALELEMAMATFNSDLTEKWVNIVRTYRRNAFEGNFDKVYFTPRNTVDGAKALKNGWAMSDVIDVCLNNELSADEVVKLSVGVNRYGA